MIRAYHQVGTDSMTPEERAWLFDDIAELKEIIPAISRVKRREMEDECWTLESEGITIRGRFPKASPEILAALDEIARRKVARLPLEGTTHTLFNCLDFIAGDMESVFLSIGDWYAVPNGFVFDAGRLLSIGAKFRPIDLLGFYERAISRIAKRRFASIPAAVEAVEKVIREVHDAHETIGKAGIEELEACVAATEIAEGRKKDCPTGEITWSGSLPLDLAIEAWQEGILVWSASGKGGSRWGTMSR